MRSNKFSDQLKKLRTEKGISQQELADLLGFKSKQRVSDYEIGRSEPSLDDIIKLANYFQVDLEYLIMDRKTEKYGLTDKKEDTPLLKEPDLHYEKQDYELLKKILTVTEGTVEAQKITIEALQAQRDDLKKTIESLKRRIEELEQRSGDQRQAG